MSAARRDPRFGLFLIPNAADYPDLLRQVAAVEGGGLDLVGIQDHPYQRRYWSGERTIDYDGRHYQVAGLHPGPPPAHEIGIWIGSYKPRMLDLTGRVADGWLPSYGGAPPEAIPEMTKQIDEGAARAGRDPGDVRRLYNVKGTIADGPVRERLNGPPDHWIETLTGFVLELGFDTFIFSPDDDVLGQIERFAQEVAPGVREAVAAR